MFHWKNVIYSDENRIEIRSGRIHFVRRPKGLNYWYNHSKNRPKFHLYLKKRKFLYSQTGQLGPWTILYSRIYGTTCKYKFQNITFQIFKRYLQLFKLNFSKFRSLLSRICLIQSHKELMPLSRTKQRPSDTILKTVRNLLRYRFTNFNNIVFL